MKKAIVLGAATLAAFALVCAGCNSSNEPSGSGNGGRGGNNATGGKGGGGARVTKAGERAIKTFRQFHADLQKFLQQEQKKLKI